MRDADETIQRLLQGLRDVKPAAGMEQRVVTAIQHAAEAREAASSGRRSVLRPLWSRQTFATLMASAAVLALVLLLIRTGHPHQQTLSNASSQPHRPHVGQTIEPFEVAPEVAVRSRGSRHLASAVPNRVRSHHALADEVSVSSSYPAPPLPLTEQERLLLRLARRRDPGSLTLLNPDVRGAETARAAEQFGLFFGMNDQEMRTQLE